MADNAAELTDMDEARRVFARLVQSYGLEATLARLRRETVVTTGQDGDRQTITITTTITVQGGNEDERTADTD